MNCRLLSVVQKRMKETSWCCKLMYMVELIDLSKLGIESFASYWVVLLWSYSENSICPFSV